MGKLVAITGGIGSGKSTVCSLLKEMGYLVFSCDEIYKEIIDEPKYVERVKEIFPGAVINGAIDRKQLSEIVFNSPAKLQQLNDVAHPLIMERLISRMRAAKGSFIFAEVPLLLEGHFESLFDFVVVVYRPENQRIDAVMQRDNLSINDVKNRIKSQFNYESEDGQMHLREIDARIIYNDECVNKLKLSILQTLSNM